MFDLANYETVEERLIKFWKDYPDGRIETELIEASATRFIIKASIFRTEVDIKAWTTGLAFELVTDRGVNATSALENGETSAIGRALANANYAAKGKRASREEMTKVASAPKHVVSMVGSIDPWTTSTTKEPVLLGDGVEMVSGVFNPPATPTAPLCAHGAMKIKQGNSPKTGKDYLGYICDRMDKSEQCSPIWYRKNPEGQWVKP
jgi:hypothetical protein